MTTAIGGRLASETPVAGRTQVIVIGAGPAGLAAALRVREAGLSVMLIQKGLGGLQLGQGTLDVLGYAPERVGKPLEAIPAFTKANPKHPYNVIPTDAVREGVEWFAQAVGDQLLVGDAGTNLMLPTAVGAVRPTAYASPSMVNGACVNGAKFVIVGLRRLKDFYADLVAQNLARTTLPDGGTLTARAISVDLPGRGDEADVTGLTYARLLDDPSVRQRLAYLVKHSLEGADPDTAVGFPAVLGLKDAGAWLDLQEQIGHKIFEIPLQPPSVPGMRLNDHLITKAKQAGVRVVLGSFVTHARTEGDKVVSVITHAAGGEREYRADQVIYAAGGFESGALTLDSYMKLHETVFDLPLAPIEGEPTHGDYWGDPQPLFLSGVRVDEQMRVLDDAGKPVYQNLRAAGGILAGATRWQEKSGEGIALGSAVAAASAVTAAIQGGAK